MHLITYLAFSDCNKIRQLICQKEEVYLAHNSPSSSPRSDSPIALGCEEGTGWQWQGVCGGANCFHHEPGNRERQTDRH
jgi:hypothetical protein